MLHNLRRKYFVSIIGKFDRECTEASSHDRQQVEGEVFVRVNTRYIDVGGPGGVGQPLLIRTERGRIKLTHC